MNDEREIDELLKLLKCKPARIDAARRALSDSLDASRGALRHSSNVARRGPQQKPPTALDVALANVINSRTFKSNEANTAKLKRVKKNAEALLKELHTLRSHPEAHTAFWGQASFGPIEPSRNFDPIDPRAPNCTEIGIERGGVLSMLGRIAEAAEDALHPGRNSMFRTTTKSAPDKGGRPPDTAKQNIVDRAALLWKIYSKRRTMSKSGGGSFHSFAASFYQAASGREDSVERQVEEAVTKIEDAKKAGRN